MNSPATSIGPAPVREVTPRHVLKWIALGWSDLLRNGLPSLLHGVLVAAAGGVILLIAHRYWPLLPGAMTGFVLVGPILATGLYALSRGGGGFRAVFDAWRRGTRCLFAFGIGLLLLGSAWVGVSVLMFHLFVDTPITGPVSFLRYVVGQDDLPFLLWTVLGALGTALVFSLAVVSVPLLYERNVNLREALLTSVRATGDNPVTLGLWALFIALATALSLATFMLGFIVLYPLIGHASWHLYRDVVDTAALEPHD